MIKSNQENKQLIFHYEVLRARLEIREFFLKTTVREVYENIGQVLSLVRMQLAYLEPKTVAKSMEEISTSGDLVGQTIRDLRSMCRSFYPDVDILESGGYVQALESTIKILEFNDKKKIKIKGVEKEIAPGVKLIIFKMLLEILITIKEIEGNYTGTTIAYTEESITFTINYVGNAIEIYDSSKNEPANYSLPFQERVELIDGKFIVKKTKAGTTRIILNAPLNNYYE